MSAGLFGLLDDVAAIAKMAAASVDDVSAAASRATVKAAGVVVDDTAVTPQYVTGVTPDRELPIVRKIASGSVRNKLFIILPVALVLSQFLPWLLTPILMLGGCYLSYEGAEKVWHRLRHQDEHDVPVAEEGAGAERTLVSEAIRTDLILSAEIMVIALNEVADQGFWARLAILVVVGIVITILVYGVVGLIVKMDDVGLHLAGRSSRTLQTVGRGLVKGMPILLEIISVVGTAAMLWVGGHILLVGVHDLNGAVSSGEPGWHWLYDRIHHAEHDVSHGVPVVGGILGWLVNTLASAVIGLVVGLLIMGLLHLLPFGTKDGGHGGSSPDVPGPASEEAAGGQA
ncbi:DUF808 domain-containing protein [Nocardioides sp. KR10-350]|uniref:DUF808 domain-containing protein n=1 Tax=Nocardioides cheoyonin TaxID=3156615 RepID=UPI0032B49AE9